MVRRSVVAVVFLLAVGLVGAVVPGQASGPGRRVVVEGDRGEAARVASLARARSEADEARAALVGGSYRSVVLGSSPFAYWRLDDSMAGVLHEETGHVVLPDYLDGSAAALGASGAIIGDPDTGLSIGPSISGSNGRVTSYGGVASPYHSGALEF